MTLVERDRELATLREAWREATLGRGAMVIVSGEAGAGKTAHVQQLAGETLMPDPLVRYLLDEIERLPNILIVGGKGTGKTTLMQWLAYRRQQLGRVLVFDSHDHPAKWTGPKVAVVGNGRDYQGIWEAMLALVGKLDLGLLCEPAHFRQELRAHGVVAVFGHCMAGGYKQSNRQWQAYHHGR